MYRRRKAIESIFLSILAIFLSNFRPFVAILYHSPGIPASFGPPDGSAPLLGAPPKKRLRLDQSDDPSIAPEDNSPMLDASNDVLDAILCHLREQKDKMRLEMVCQKLQLRIKERSAWKARDDSLLCLGHNDEFTLINGHEFADEDAATALAILLDRVRVDKFMFNDFRGMPENVLLPLSDIIKQQKDNINLEYIKLLGFTENINYSPMLTSLIGCGLENLSIVEVGDWSEETYVDIFPDSIYSMLSASPNLKKLYLSIELEDIWGLLLPALANSPSITHIYIKSVFDLEGVQAIELAQLCSSTFPKLTSLIIQCGGIADFEPLEFTNALGNVCSNITQFGIELDSRVESHLNFMAQICNLFPKLTTLHIPSFRGFPSATILQLIGNIFANYTRNGNEVYDFDLNIGVNNFGKVVYRLARKIWSDNDESAYIEAENGNWTCSKDNVKIRLTLGTNEFHSDSDHQSDSDD